MDILYLIIGLVIGALVSFLIFKLTASKGLSANESSELQNQLSIAKTELAKSQEREKSFISDSQNLKTDMKSEREKVIGLSSKLSQVETLNSGLTEKLEEQKSEIENLQQKFIKEFENLANKILEEKSGKFTQMNKDNIEQILTPLKEKIKTFEDKVEKNYIEETKQRTSLYSELKNLQAMNQKITDEANNLTRALKGDSKTQGNWGEIILEKILEMSGLEKGREYVIQESHTTEEGKRFRPDVILYQPEEKHMIIDSKVSLSAYETYYSSDDDAIKENALKEHIRSVRNHIRELNVKSYQNLYSLQSLDFVIMFMPIEPALGLAVQNEPAIYSEAFEKNVIIVTPSTLLATLRTVSSIWKQENQNKNALEIARQSGQLYDKFVGFMQDLIDIGKRLDSTKDAYSDAMKKLHEGKGNLIRQVESIKTLGAKASKSLPPNLLDRAE